MNRNKLFLSIFFLSGAIIAFQLALIQILSIVQWYHFAYMVISIALLGFGAAGSVLAIFQERLVKHVEILLPVLSICTALAMSVVTDVSQLPSIRFDSYLLFAEYSHPGRLLVTYLIHFIPFFLGALAIGLVFVKYVEDIGKIYFANLLGSGAGGILIILLIRFYFAKELPALIAILPVITALMLVPKSRQIWHIGLAVLAIAVITWKYFYPPGLTISEYKDISKTLLLPEAKITLEKTSPYGIVQAATTPALRYAPGMSLTAEKTAGIKMAAFLNGDWYGAVTDWKKTDTITILDYTTSALPYIMSDRNSVLVLQSGTGTDVAHAVSRKAKKIVAVEANPVILSMLQNEFAVETDSLFTLPGVSVHNLGPRTFLSMHESRFDLIILPIVGSFGGSSGLHALQEQFILTKESFREMLLKLNAGGIISISSWMDYPIRNPLRILSTMVEVLQESGIQNPKDHIVAIRSWGTITFGMTKSPLNSTEINRIRNFCEEMMFDPAILPNLTKEERSRYNQFQDDRFFDYLDQIFLPGRKGFYEDYDFNIKPATDDKPYFSQYIKLGHFNRLADFFGKRSLPFFELGYLLIIVTLVQISIAALVLIVLPLINSGWKGEYKISTILYFSGIGLGYMFLEMIFIQRFMLYFGNQVYSASAVITLLLIFSGLGSYHSQHLIQNRNRVRMVFTFIVIMISSYAFLLTPILQQTIHVNQFLKYLIVFLLIAPLAFFMGIPFPAGLSYISKMNAAVVPWAWGINGCVSVISTALAMIVGIEAGFISVMLVAAFAYCLSFLVHIKWLKL
ncbi:spermidine synthase family protein [Flavitalea antarctica]